MRFARTIAFWTLAAGLLACNVIVMQHSLTARFWEDEAFNLTVPLNLLAGLGYSSDGALSGSTITPFDPRISTGPTVLLPVAAVVALCTDPVVGARLVPLTFWVLLIAGLALFGARSVGRWGALVAAAVPLAFNGVGSISPIQGPADLLGEIPAAALLVWALIVLPRRAWLAACSSDSPCRRSSSPSWRCPHSRSRCGCSRQETGCNDSSRRSSVPGCR